MKKFRENCLDCGSRAIRTTIDEIKPLFKMDDFAKSPSAALRSSLVTAAYP